MPANKQEAEEECLIISLVVEPWKKNQLEQFTPVHRIRGYPWRLRLYSRNGYMQVEVLCEKSKEAELWQCGATITMSEPLDVFHTYHLSSWDETKIILIGELTNSIPIIKGDLVEVKITTNQHGSKWLSRPFLNPSETSNEVFVIGEERKNIKVHKEFLMSHSPFFGDLFTDYNEFPIEGVEYEEISNILAMACGFDGASLTDDNVHRVVELARRFELEIVVDRVVSYLLSAACSLPVYQKLDVAQQYNRPFLKDMLLARYEKTSALKELVDSADFEQLSPETLRLLFMKRCSIYRMWHNTGIAAPRCKTVAPKMNYPNLDANELKDGIIVFGEKKKKKKIKINKKTLATQSSFFDHLFNGLWKEKDMTEIPLADVEYEFSRLSFGLLPFVVSGRLPSRLRLVFAPRPTCDCHSSTAKMAPLLLAVKTILRRSARIRRGAITPAREAASTTDEMESDGGMSMESDEEEIPPERDPFYIRLDSELAALEQTRVYRKREAHDEDVLEVADQKNAAQIRELYCDVVEHSLMQTLGEQLFKRRYPNRHSRSNPNRGDGAHQNSIYSAQLLDMELNWNAVNASANQPGLILQDWTGNPPDADSLRRLQFIQHALLSSDARRILERQPRSTSKTKCDAVHSDHGSCTVVPKGPGSAQVECTKDCPCDENVCKNRDSQRGRQKLLMIFRDFSKGWSIRALQEYERHEFVSEYVGEVISEPSTDPAVLIYDFGMGAPIPRQNGPSRELFLNSHAMGNESRFYAHDCSPSLYSQSTIVSREHAGLRHIIFRAAGVILRGSELTFHYFPGLTLADIDISPFFAFCLCGSSNCQFSESKLRAFKETENAGSVDGSESGDKMDTDHGTVAGTAEEMSTEDGGEAAAADDLVEVFNWRFGASELVKSNGETLRRIRAEIAAGSWFLEIRDKRTYKKESTGPPEVPELITIDDDEAEMEQEQPGTSASHYGRSSTR